MLVRFFLLVMWLLQCLPIGILAPLGKGLGALLYLLARERRHITLTNLGLCFPHMTEAERVTVAKQHFAAFGRSFLERPLTWWASAEWTSGGAVGIARQTRQRHPGKTAIGLLRHAGRKITNAQFC